MFVTHTVNVSREDIELVSLGLYVLPCPCIMEHAAYTLMKICTTTLNNFLFGGRASINSTRHVFPATMLHTHQFIDYYYNIETMVTSYSSLY